MIFKPLVAALAFSAAVLGSPIPQDEFEGREQIVGGVEASAGDFPFIVSLQTSSGSHFCGGSLINGNTVLTAAHCSTGRSASSVRIRAGSLNRGSGGVIASVSAIRIHPSYSSSTLNNDVAIWKLSTSIPQSSTISYASLAASGSEPATGSVSSVAGWGTTSSGSSSSPTLLRKVDVPIVSRASCRASYGTSAVTDNMVCAGYTSGGRDSCQGDSGGPLVNASTRSLIGVVSWGRGCAAANYPGVYARVGTLRSWIDQNL